MYVGDIRDGSALANMIWELVANAVDEHLAGHGSSVQVHLHADGSIRVADQGRGMRVDPVDGIPYPQWVFTSLHHTPTRDGHAPHEHVRAGVGSGLFPICALSAWLEVAIDRDGRHWVQRFERGVPVSTLRDAGPSERSGTVVRFMPDPQVFGNSWLNPGTIAARLRELAFLLPGFRFEFIDERHHAFESREGLIDPLREWPVSVSGPVFQLEATAGDIHVRLAATWARHARDLILSWANLVPTPEGGTHVQGLQQGLAQGLRIAAPLTSDGRADEALQDVACKSVQAVLQVRVCNPRWGSPTTDRLVNPDVVAKVAEVVAPAFARWLDDQPDVLTLLLGRFL